MTELALMTVEITVTDRDSQGFDLGGPKEQARAATALAQRGEMLDAGTWPISTGFRRPGVDSQLPKPLSGI
jgi:hypothetical protein